VTSKMRLPALLIVLWPVAAFSEQTLPVRVIDSSGAPVTGLTAADFGLWVDDREVPLTAVEPIDPVRSTVLVIDSAYLTRKEMNRLCRVAERIVAAEAGPGSRIMLVHTDGDIAHMTGFTSRPAPLIEAIDDLEYRGTLFREIKEIERRILDHAVPYLRSRGTQPYHRNQVVERVAEKHAVKARHLEAFYANMLRVERVLREAPGSRSIWLLTGGVFLDTSPGDPSIDLMDGLAGRLVDAGISVHAVMESHGNLPFFALINNYGYSLVASRVPEAALAETSVFPPDEETVPNPRANTVFENRVQDGTGPETLARLTGGLMTRVADDALVEAALDQLARTRGGYLLRFPGEPESRARFRVTCRREGTTAIYPRLRDRPGSYLELDPSAREVALEALLVDPDSVRDALDLAFDTAVFLGEDGTYRTAVFTRVPIREQRRLELAFAARDKDGALLDVTRATLDDFDQTPDLAVYDVLITETLPVTVRAYVRDLDSGAYSLAERRVSPEMPATRARPVSKILLAARRPAQIVILNLRHADSVRNNLRRRDDPLVFEDKRFFPRPDTRFEAPETIEIAFHLATSVSTSDLEIDVALHRADGLEVIAGTTLYRHETRRAYRYIGSLDARSLTPGDYQLEVTVTDAEGTGYTRATGFTVVEDD